MHLIARHRLSRTGGRVDVISGTGACATHRYVIEIPALMDNATWEAEAL
jgi:hypothetical protein